MTRTTTLLMALSVVALAACNNPRGGMFGGGGADGFGGADAMGGGFNDGGISSMALGDPNDPRSIAHFQQRIGDRVFFSTDSASLTSEGRMTLDGQARWLNANPQFAILIEGHADERGTREYNVDHPAIPDFPRCQPAALAHCQLWQGAPRRGLRRAALLGREPARRDHDLRHDVRGWACGTCSSRAWSGG